MTEAALYPPIKAYLEAQGYEVKAEIGDCDMMAVRGDEPPVIVELKTTFSLALVLQGTERQSMFDHVYLAVPVPPKRGWGPRYRDILRLCRRLGLGLLAVKGGRVEAHLDPGPYQPRRRTQKAGRLLREFERRVGDPNLGGTTRTRRMTAYRQDALRCLAHLHQNGPSSPAAIVKGRDVTKAGAILRDDHYGWFGRVSRGVYQLTPQGQAAVAEYAGELSRLALTPRR